MEEWCRALFFHHEGERGAMAYEPDERPRDLRVEKTIDTIQATFKQMMLEMDFDKITVKALCERARINKKTFYRYYPAIEYLLAEVQHEYSEPYIQRTRNLRFPKDAGLIARTFLEFSIAQDELYERITCGGPHDRIREQMIGQVEGERHDDDQPEGWPDGSWGVYLSIVCSAPLQAYQAWVANGKTLPAREMIDATVAAVTAASRAFEKNVASNRQ